MESTTTVPPLSSSTPRVPPIPKRCCFTDTFIFGTSSSAYQYEGAAKEGGKGESIWDTFTHKCPVKIDDGSNGDLAVDFYHKYEEDIKIMKEMGFDAFRFSISWSRILPRGRRTERRKQSGKKSESEGGEPSDLVNEEGIKFYNDLINKLIANGLKPFVTLFHWDLPQALEDEYGGFLNAQIVDDFRRFADLCFSRFGDRVEHWITLNEPWAYSVFGYETGHLAPGRGHSSETSGNNSSENKHTQGLHTLHRAFNFQQEVSNNGDNGDNGDLGKELYVVSHNLLLAHAAAFHLYKQKYKDKQKGKIGISLVSSWMKPFNSESKEDHDAVKRALDFMLGWFMDPLITGDYPASMRNHVGSRLPSFKSEDPKLKESFDFIGINYYTARFVADKKKKVVSNSCSDKLSYTTDPEPDTKKESYETDPELEIRTTNKDGDQIGQQAPGSKWIYIHPEGLYDLLKHMKTKYNNPLIYITENGVSEEDRNDKIRQEYHTDHLTQLLHAIEIEKVNVKGYFAWSLLDNFEWHHGYKVRFGLIHVDYENGNLTRTQKDSAKWFSKFLKRDT